jgi:hypothetical protein
MEQVEMNNMYIDIDVNNGSEKCTEKTLKQRTLLDRSKHSQQTNNHVPGGIRTHNPSKWATANLCLRPRVYWDRHIAPLVLENEHFILE